MLDPPIYRQKRQLMQRLLRAMNDGYIHWISGRIPFAKADHFVQKMNDKFGLSISQPTRYRHQQRGIANAKIFIHPLPDSGECWWIIVMTDGEHPNRDSEVWSDARHAGGRIILWGDDYEMIRQPSKTQKNDRPSWTWRMTSANFEDLKNRVRAACRQKNDLMISQIIYNLLRAPGFSVIRKQVFEIMHIGQKEFEKSFGKDVKNSFSSRFHGWIRFKADSTVPLSVLIYRYTHGITPLIPPPPIDPDQTQLEAHLEKGWPESTKAKLELG